MKTINQALKQRLDTGVATLCLCWKFQRMDEQIFGATDHNEALSFDGVTYMPSQGLSDVSFTSTRGLAPGYAQGRSGLSAHFLSDEDLANGKWDQARITVWRVDWQDETNRVLVWSGEMGDVSHDGQAFQANLISLKVQLERKIGRIYSRQCDAQLGDTRCALDLQTAAYQTDVNVQSVPSARSVIVSDLSSFAAGWFVGGRAVDEAGGAHVIVSQDGNRLGLNNEHGLQIGANLTLIAGCDKRYETCRSKFSNILNFRGFPHLPGMDAVLAGPSARADNNGGRRL